MTAIAPNYAPGLRREFITETKAAVAHCYEKHGDAQWGRHEFYGILKEELDELWDAIKQDLPQEEVRYELLHVAAVCLRYYEIGDRDRGTLRPAGVE
jgi:hypothetical protein